MSQAHRASLPVLFLFMVVLFLAAALVLPAGCGSETPAGGYEVGFEFACVDGIDYMEFNRLCNYLESYREGQPVDERVASVIDSTSFGHSISLLTSSGDSLATSYSFEPGQVDTSAEDGVTTFFFDSPDIPEKAGVPYVSVSGVVAYSGSGHDDGDGTILNEEEKELYTKPTRYWPCSDPAVRDIALTATDGAGTQTERVRSVFEWVRNNLVYGGPVAGSRWGTMEVLHSGEGRCWDFSDVTVTLLRAAGIPSRQVAGWLVEQDTGHVWAQAYLDGEGWIDVDTTNYRLGAGSGYLPFFATYDGEMPILYVKMPTVEEE